MISIRSLENLVYSAREEVVIASVIQMFMQQHGIQGTVNTVLLDALKAGPPDKGLVDKFRRVMPRPTVYDLMQVFEIMVCKGAKQGAGVFYTPENVARMMAEINLGDDLGWNKTVLDPCCGAGVFLLQAAEILHRKLHKPFINIIEDNLYGVDILQQNVQRTKILLSLLALEHGEDKKNIKFNIIHGDTLALKDFNDPSGAFFRGKKPIKVRVEDTSKDPYWANVSGLAFEGKRKKLKAGELFDPSRKGKLHGKLFDPEEVRQLRAWVYSHRALTTVLNRFRRAELLRLTCMPFNWRRKYMPVLTDLYVKGLVDYHLAEGSPVYFLTLKGERVAARLCRKNRLFVRGNAGEVGFGKGWFGESERHSRVRRS